MLKLSIAAAMTLSAVLAASSAQAEPVLPLPAKAPADMHCFLVEETGDLMGIEVPEGTAVPKEIVPPEMERTFRDSQGKLTVVTFHLEMPLIHLTEVKCVRVK